MPTGVYTRKNIKPLAERLLDKVIPEPNSGCWLFDGYVDAAGYGAIRERKKSGKILKAHRASFVCFVGPIKKGLHVLHSCDTRCCVNPNHLWLGTHSDNMADMAKKGRSGSRAGESHNKAKLNEKTVLNIFYSSIGCTTLSREIGISETTIKDIRNKKIWRETTAGLER